MKRRGLKKGGQGPQQYQHLGPAPAQSGGMGGVVFVVILLLVVIGAAVYFVKKAGGVSEAGSMFTWKESPLSAATVQAAKKEPPFDKLTVYTNTHDDGKLCGERCTGNGLGALGFSSVKPEQKGDRCECNTTNFENMYGALLAGKGKVPGGPWPDDPKLAGERSLWPCKHQGFHKHDNDGPGPGDLAGCIKGWQDIR